MSGLHIIYGYEVAPYFADEKGDRIKLNESQEYITEIFLWWIDDLAAEVELANNCSIDSFSPFADSIEGIRFFVHVKDKVKASIWERFRPIDANWYESHSDFQPVLIAVERLEKKMEENEHCFGFGGDVYLRLEVLERQKGPVFLTAATHTYD